MWAAKITALPCVNDCRPLGGLKPNRSHPKALTSCGQCHLFQTGVNLAVQGKPGLLGNGYLYPWLCCSLSVPGRVERAVQQLLEFLPGEVIPTDQAGQGDGV